MLVQSAPLANSFLPPQCYRSEEPVDGARPDLYIRHKHYYKRRGVERFVRELSKHFDVAVYSSMMLHNLEAGINAVLSGEKGRLVAILDRCGSNVSVKDMTADVGNERRPRFTLTEVVDRNFRTMNKPDPDGENEWDTVRDMRKVLPTLLPREVWCSDDG